MFVDHPGYCHAGQSLPVHCAFRFGLCSVCFVLSTHEESQGNGRNQPAESARAGPRNVSPQALSPLSRAPRPAPLQFMLILGKLLRYSTFLRTCFVRSRGFSEYENTNFALTVCCGSYAELLAAPHTGVDVGGDDAILLIACSWWAHCLLR